MNASAEPQLVQAELEKRAEWAAAHGHDYDFAVWQLLCGRLDEGLRALRAQLAATSGASAGSSFMRPQLAAIAGDWDRAEQDARLALGESTERLVPGYRAYLRSLYGLLAGAPETVPGQLETLREHVGGRREYPRGALPLVEGLLTRSERLATDGLDSLLGWHLRRARARSDIFNSARAVVSLDAVFVLLLARRLGLALGVGPAYRRASLPLLILHLHEWRGEPLPRGLPASVEVDLVAGRWLGLQGLLLPDPPRDAGEG